MIRALFSFFLFILSFPLAAQAQSIVMVDSPGHGSASFPFIFEWPLASPMPLTQSHSARLEAVGAPAGGTWQIMGNTAPSWLFLNISKFETGALLSVTALSRDLPPGVYDAVFIVGYQAAGVALNLPLNVRLILGSLRGTTALVAVPRSFALAAVAGARTSRSFYWDVGSSDNNPVEFSMVTTTSSGGNWLIPSTSPGTMSTTRSGYFVMADATNLTASSTPYFGTITLTPANRLQPPMVVPVMLTVTAPSTPTSLRLDLRPQSIGFLHQAGAPAPDARAVMVTTPVLNPLLKYSTQVTTSSGGNWLLAQTGVNTVPGVFLVSVVPAVVNTLPPGTYSGQVSVTASGNSTPAAIPVTLTVSPSPQPTISSYSVVLNGSGGDPAATQVIQVGSTGTPLDVTVTAQGGNWLRAALDRSRTPAALSITAANVFGLTPGVYNGSVTVASAGGSLTIPVTLNLSESNLILASTSELRFSGDNPETQTVRLAGSTGPASFFASLSTGASWLQLNPTNGVTPSTLQVSATRSSLSPGSYANFLMVSSSGNSIYIPVVYTVTPPAASITPSPGIVSLTMQQGQTAPPSQSIALSATLPTPFTVSTGAGSLIDVTPPSGTAPAALTVRPGAGSSSLAPGSYRATITITANGGGTLEVPVTLVVTAPPPLTAAPQALTFAGRERSPQGPAAQSVALSAPAGTPFTATVIEGGTWLSVSPSSGVTPANLSVQASSATLAAGTYTGAIVLSGGGGAAIRIPVTFNVEAVPAAIVSRIAHGATFQAGPVAPGLLATLFGTNLAPPDRTFGAQLSGGRVARSLGGVRVLFDGNEAPLLFVREDQINCVVPYALNGRVQTRVQVDNNGLLSAPQTFRVEDTAPGLFNLGAGQAAALNQDGSVNGAANPAARGQVMVLYATGDGALSPPGVDGEITATVKQPIAPVSLRVGGVEVPRILYAGAAPGLVQGVLQINFVVPDEAPSGANVPVVLTVGGAASPPGMTIALR